MYNDILNMLTFQRTQDDHHDQETVKTGRPNLWSKLLAGVGNVLFSADQESNVQDDEVRASQRLETYPVSGYVAYCPEYYDLGVYWYDF